MTITSRPGGPEQVDSTQEYEVEIVNPTWDNTTSAATIVSDINAAINASAIGTDFQENGQCFIYVEHNTNDNLFTVKSNPTTWDVIVEVS